MLALVSIEVVLTCTSVIFSNSEIFSADAIVETRFQIAHFRITEEASVSIKVTV